MRVLTRGVALLTCLLVLLATQCNTEDAGHDGVPRLFESVTDPDSRPAVAEAPWAIRVAAVVPGRALLEPDHLGVGDSLAVELFDGEVFLASVTSISQVVGRQNVRATILEPGAGDVLLTLGEGHAAGIITLTDGRRFDLRHDATTSTHLLIEVDPELLDEVPGDPPVEEGPEDP